MHFNRFDQLLTGVWWWRRRRRLAEEMMDDAAQVSDHEAQAIYQREWIPMKFAERFGRPASARVRKVVELAQASGADSEALAVVVANRDVFEIEDRIVLRDVRIVWAMTIASRLMLTFAAIYWFTIVNATPVAFLVQTLLMLIGVLLIGACASALELFGGKELRAMRAVRNDLEQAISAANPSSTAPPKDAAIIALASRRPK